MMENMGHDLTPRQRIAMALQMQRGMAPQGSGAVGGLNQALKNGLQLYGMRANQRSLVPQGPDPVMGTGYPMLPQGF